MPYYMSFLGFFLTLTFASLIGSIFNIDSMMFYYSIVTQSNGFVFEAGVSWLPIVLAILVGHLSWKLGKRKFPKEKLDL